MIDFEHYYKMEFDAMSDLLGSIRNITTPNCVEDTHHRCSSERQTYINNIMAQLTEIPISEKVVASTYLLTFVIGIGANLLVMSVLMLNTGTLKVSSKLLFAYEA